MRFRVTEFITPNKDGNRFFVEKGTPYRIKWFLGERTAWEVILGNDEKPLAYKTMDEAVIVINELRGQLPIHHEIK